MSLKEVFTRSQAIELSTPAGMVFVIRCVPDIFTGESLNIGVAAVSVDGKRKAKVITESGRLECFYGTNSKQVLMLAAAALEAALQAGVSPPSSQITFDVPRPFYNASLDEIVESTFLDQVTAARPHRETQVKAKVTDEQALKQVLDAIKQMPGFDMDLIANTPQVVIQTDRGPREMTIPLQPPHGVGTVRSAHYGAATVKAHLMDSVLDLQCAAMYRKKDRLGLFVLRPSKGSEADLSALDDVIDSIHYRISREKMMFEAADEPELLAEAITKWGQE